MSQEDKLTHKAPLPLGGAGGGLLGDGLSSYLTSHISPEPDYLYRLWRATNVQLLHGRMASGHIQGRLLKMFVEMIRPQNILEVGTFSGYSAICMAEGLKELGVRSEELGVTLNAQQRKLFTFEINDEMEPFTRQWIDNSPVAEYIDFRIGDAIKEAPQLGITFDMAFIDGDKRTYVETYEMVLSIMRPGGWIFADNTLWDGHVTDPAYDRDHQTQGIRRFNDLVAHDERVEKVILPLRDGLTIIRKK
jgi:predicted O-methyltransferase YrrM